MATACSEDLPISPTDNKSASDSLNSSGSKSVSRSPSISSIKEERWPILVVSREPKIGVRSVVKCKSTLYFGFVSVIESPQNRACVISVFSKWFMCVYIGH